VDVKAGNAVCYMGESLVRRRLEMAGFDDAGKKRVCLH
jgi:hypothetical protein